MFLESAHYHLKCKPVQQVGFVQGDGYRGSVVMGVRWGNCLIPFVQIRAIIEVATDIGYYGKNTHPFSWRAHLLERCMGAR